MVKLIIFDFWGTLVSQGIYSPVKQVKFILGIEEDFSSYITQFEESFMTMTKVSEIKTSKYLFKYCRSYKV